MDKEKYLLKQRKIYEKLRVASCAGLIAAGILTGVFFNESREKEKEEKDYVDKVVGNHVTSREYELDCALKELEEYCEESIKRKTGNQDDLTLQIKTGEVKTITDNYGYFNRCATADEIRELKDISNDGLRKFASAIGTGSLALCALGSAILSHWKIEEINGKTVEKDDENVM